MDNIGKITIEEKNKLLNELFKINERIINGTHFDIAKIT